MAIASGDVDQLSNIIDDEWLLNQSQSGLNVKDKVIFHKQYHMGHTSFTMGNDTSYFRNDIIPLISISV